MTPKRLWHSLRLTVARNGYARAKYLREHHLMHHVGKGVYYQGRKSPLYSELISMGDNVKIASRVNFITHSIIHSMLNSSRELNNGKVFQEQIGCIEIGSNVFIGAGTSILQNVKIGSNVIIAAESVVTKDIPSNSVIAGVPARVIETMDEYLSKAMHRLEYPAEMVPNKQTVSPKLIDFFWNEFKAQRSKDR